MKQPDWESCTEEELWQYVGWHLSRNGIDTVLVGGAVVSIYCEGQYRSGDLDLVIITYTVKRDVDKVMSEIGFGGKSGRHYFHPECSHIFVEFVPPPLSIGSDVKIAPRQIVIEGQIIKILSPTDSIKDRLASYIYFNARECLDQAVMVAFHQPFDLDKVKDWCEKEGQTATQAYQDFLRLSGK